MNRTPLTGADLVHWIALRRVADGGIARMGDCWYDSGRRTPGYVADALAEFCHAGLVALADPGPGGMAPTALTAAGTARYEQLCQQRQKALQMPAPPFGVTRKPSPAADADPEWSPTARRPPDMEQTSRMRALPK